MRAAKTCMYIRKLILLIAFLVLLASPALAQVTIKVVDAADNPLEDLYIELEVSSGTATPSYTDDAGELIFLDTTHAGVDNIRVSYNSITFSYTGDADPNATYAGTATTGDTPTYTTWASVVLDDVIWVKLDGYVQRGSVLNESSLGLAGVNVIADTNGDGDLTGEMIVQTMGSGHSEFILGEYLIFISVNWQGTITASDGASTFAAYLDFFTPEGNLEMMDNGLGYDNVAGFSITASLEGVNFIYGYSVSGNVTEFGSPTGVSTTILADADNDDSKADDEPSTISNAAAGGSYTLYLPTGWSGEIIATETGYQASATTLDSNGLTYDDTDKDYNVASLSGNVVGADFQAPAGTGSVTVHLLDYSETGILNFTVKLSGAGAVTATGVDSVMVTVPSLNNVQFEWIMIWGLELTAAYYSIDDGGATRSWVAGVPSGTLDFSTNSHLWIKIDGFVAQGALGSASAIASNINNPGTNISTSGGYYAIFISYSFSVTLTIKGYSASGYYTVDPGSMTGTGWSVEPGDVNTYSFDTSLGGRTSGHFLDFSDTLTGNFSIDVQDADSADLPNVMVQLRAGGSNIGPPVSGGSSTASGLDIDSIDSAIMASINGAANVVSSITFNGTGGAFPDQLLVSNLIIYIDGWIAQGIVQTSGGLVIPDSVVRTDTGRSAVFAGDDKNYALYIPSGDGAAYIQATKVNATYTASNPTPTGNWAQGTGIDTDKYTVTTTLSSGTGLDFIGVSTTGNGNLTVKLIDCNSELIDHLTVTLDNVGTSSGVTVSGEVFFSNISLDVELVTISFSGTSFTLAAAPYSTDSTDGVDGTWSATVPGLISGSTLWVKLGGYIAYGALGSGANQVVVSGGGSGSPIASDNNSYYAVFIPFGFDAAVTIKARADSSYYLAATTPAANTGWTRILDINTFTFDNTAATKKSLDTGLDFSNVRTHITVRLVDARADNRLIFNFWVRIRGGGSTLAEATDGGSGDADGAANGSLSLNGTDIDRITSVTIIRVFSNSIPLTVSPGSNLPDWGLASDEFTVPTIIDGSPGLDDVVVNDQDQYLWLKVDGYLLQGVIAGYTPGITLADGNGASSIAGVIDGSNNYSVYVPTDHQLATNADGSNAAPMTITASNDGYIVTTAGTPTANGQSGTLTAVDNRYEFDNLVIDGSPYGLDFSSPDISDLTFYVVSDSGSLVPNAQIRLNGNNSLRSRDGDDGVSDGVVHFSGLSLSNLTDIGVNLRGTTYLTPSEYSIDGGTTWEPDIPTLPAVSPTIHVKLSPDDVLMLRGTVYDKPQADPDKQPMAGVQVWALGNDGSGNYESVTDGTGVYEIQNVPKGWTGTVMASTPGYFFEPLNIDPPGLQINVSNDFFGTPLTSGVFFKFFGEEPDSGFGYSMDMTCDGLTMVVGTQNGNKAYVFGRASEDDSWEFQRRLVPSDSPTGFGHSVAISPDGAVIAVGSSGSNKAYIYSLAATGSGSWGDALGDSLSETGALAGGGGSSFGSALALYDDGSANYTLAVGASGAQQVDIFSSSGGSSWSGPVTLTTSDSTADFGAALGLSDDGGTLVVGSPADGVAYLYLKADGSGNDGAWEAGENDFVTKLLPTGADDNFGVSVDVDGDGATVVVGANGVSSNTGAAYVFTAPGDDWKTAGATKNQAATLTDPDGGSGSLLGTDVVISTDGEVVIASAPGEDKLSFFGGTWSGSMTPTVVLEGESGNLFGTSMALNCAGTELVVGSPAYDGGRGTIDAYKTPNTYEVCGLIMDNDGNGPIVGATITAVTTSGKEPDVATVVTDATGKYCITLYRGWSGTLTPSIDGYSFDPAFREYTNIFGYQCCHHYKALLNEIDITGVVTNQSGNPLEGVKLDYTGGITVETNAAGEYTISVYYGWSGNVTPSMPGYDFTPNQRTYSSLAADQTNQDYSARWIPYFVITASAGNGGSISPSGGVRLIEGSSQSFLIKTDDGYRIADVLVDGESVGAVGSYSFTNVRRDHTIRAKFTRADHGWLKVIIKPNAVIVLGAAWRLVGWKQWLPSGAVLELPPGKYEIEFRPVEFWGNYCPIEAIVYSRKTTVVEEVCYEELEAGAKVHYFVADDYIVCPSVGAVLSWLVRGANNVFISFVGEVDAEDSLKVNPAANTSYWLTAIGAANTAADKVAIEAIDQPLIDWFVTDATAENPVRPGEKARLMWRVHGAQEVEVAALDNDGSVSAAATGSASFGEKKLKPKQTQQYRLTAQNAAGEATSEVEVHVDAKPRVEQFGSEHSTLLLGRQTKLSWKVVGADSVKLLPLDETVKKKGSKHVSPLQTTTYKLWAANEYGQVSAECTVQVADNATDVVLDFAKILFDGLEVDEAYAGNELEAVVAVLNDGPAVARDFDIVLSDGKKELARKRVKKVGVGRKKTVKLPFIPMEKNKRLQLTVEADPDKALPEDKRDNNSSTLRLKVIQSPLAELVVGDVSMTAVGAGENSGVIIGFKLYNVGSEEAKDFQVDVEVDGRLVFWEAIRGLAARQSRSFRATTVPGDRKRFTIKILADRYHVVGEINRENNLRQIKVELNKLGNNW